MAVTDCCRDDSALKASPWLCPITQSHRVLHRRLALGRCLLFREAHAPGPPLPWVQRIPATQQHTSHLAPFPGVRGSQMPTHPPNHTHPGGCCGASPAESTSLWAALPGLVATEAALMLPSPRLGCGPQLGSPDSRTVWLRKLLILGSTWPWAQTLHGSSTLGIGHLAGSRSTQCRRLSDTEECCCFPVCAAGHHALLQSSPQSTSEHAPVGLQSEGLAAGRPWLAWPGLPPPTEGLGRAIGGLAGPHQDWQAQTGRGPSPAHTRLREDVCGRGTFPGALAPWHRLWSPSRIPHSTSQVWWSFGVGLLGCAASLPQWMVHHGNAHQGTVSPGF